MLQNTSALYCSSFTFQYRIVCTVVVQQRNNMMQNFFHQLSIIISLVVGRISSTSIKWDNKIEWWRLYYWNATPMRGSYSAMSHYVCKLKTNKIKKYEELVLPKRSSQTRDLWRFWMIPNWQSGHSDQTHLVCLFVLGLGVDVGSEAHSHSFA